jgi:hypothetical protein
MKPEEEARKKIDVLLEKAGWQIQDQKDLNTLLSLKAQKYSEKENSNILENKKRRQRDPRPVYLYMVQGVGFEPTNAYAIGS